MRPIAPLASLVGAGIVALITVAVTNAQDPLAGGAIFVLGGVAAGVAIRRPAAWLVPLVASPIVAVIDLGDSEVPSPFSDQFVVVMWLVTATPGMVAAALVGALLEGNSR